MPSRRGNDASDNPQAALLGRSIWADRTTATGRKAARGWRPARHVVKVAGTVLVVAGLLLLVPRVVGSGLRPQLTDIPLAILSTVPPVAVPPLGTMIPAPTAAATPATRVPLPPIYADIEQQVLALVNAARLQQGCQPVRLDGRLSAAARGHTEDMAVHDMFSHQGSNGSTPLQRAQARGYPGPVGENIARGYPTPQAVMAGWLASPPHRANILNCSARVMGAAYLAAGEWWTEMFGL